RTRPFLGYRGGSAQFWINLRIYLCNWLDDFLWIIFVYNFDRLLFAGSISVIKLRSWRRESHRHSRTRAKCDESQKDNERGGEKFSHKAATYRVHRPVSQPIFSTNVKFFI